MTAVHQTTQARDRGGPADPRAATTVGIVAIVFTGAIFGFFFAWVCSTM